MKEEARNRAPVERDVRTQGWYWVRRKNWSDEDYGDWIPAFWDKRHWNSVNFRNCPDIDIIVGDPIRYPNAELTGVAKRSPS
jgi:hypothetical protein